MFDVRCLIWPRHPRWLISFSFGHEGAYRRSPDRSDFVPVALDCHTEGRVCARQRCVPCGSAELGGSCLSFEGQIAPVSGPRLIPSYDKSRYWRSCTNCEVEVHRLRYTRRQRRAGSSDMAVETRHARSVRHSDYLYPFTRSKLREATGRQFPFAEVTTMIFR